MWAKLPVRPVILGHFDRPIHPGATACDKLLIRASGSRREPARRGTFESEKGSLQPRRRTVVDVDFVSSGHRQCADVSASHDGPDAGSPRDVAESFTHWSSTRWHDRTHAEAGTCWTT